MHQSKGELLQLSKYPNSGSPIPVNGLAARAGDHRDAYQTGVPTVGNESLRAIDAVVVTVRRPG